MYKVWGFGSAAVDIRITTADYGENYRDKLLAREMLVLGGGACANCLTQIARLGGKAGWLGKLGMDGFGRQIVASLRSEGIDCSRIAYCDDCSPFNVAIYAGEQKRRVGGFLLPNTLASLTDEELTRLASVPAAGDWLAMEIGEIPLEHCLTLARRAKERGVRVAIDVDLDPIRQCGGTQEQVEALFALSDLLIPNVVALSSLYAADGAEDLCRRLYAACGVPVVTTAGADGAYFMDTDGVLHRQAALPTDVIDTVGAGDAFHGGLLQGVAEGLPLSDAVALGTVCASLNCTAFGAREGMPTRAQAAAHIASCADTLPATLVSRMQQQTLGKEETDSE